MKKHFRFCISILLLVTVSCTNKPTVKENRPLDEILDSNPKLTKPVVRKIWVPEKIEDDGVTMTGGHWKYIIDRGATWAK